MDFTLTFSRSDFQFDVMCQKQLTRQFLCVKVQYTSHKRHLMSLKVDKLQPKVTAPKLSLLQTERSTMSYSQWY